MKDRQQLIIGKSAGCDIVVDSPYVSGRHARLIQDGGRWLIEDLGSKNGVRVNDKERRIAGPTPVEKRDIVYLGPVPVKFADLLARRNAEAHLAPVPLAKRPKGGRMLLIGRSPKADIRFNFDYISREHALLTEVGKGRWVIEDLGSKHGTFVGGRRHRVTGPVELKENEKVYFGTYGIVARKLFDKTREKRERLKADVTLRVTGRESIIVGRDPDAHIVLDYPQISWHHTRITPLGEQNWVVEDLGSRNGTFVNGGRISKATIRSTDKISLGSYELNVSVDNQVVARNLTGDLRLDSVSGSLEIKVGKERKRLLYDVTFTIFPSEFVGLMGLSGAGKTTLLTSLIGYRKFSQGRAEINGLNVYDHYDQFKTMIGYVPQDDILHGELNVEEALMFAARLRLPYDMSTEDIRARVYETLERLDLYRKDGSVDVRHVAVNPSGRKGVSGGQRKRINLAMELITEPTILFLDEPTSGLSSVDTISVMKLLRGLADQGKTIILTLHQPDIESFRQLDNTIILDHGELVYYGPAWPDSLTFFNPQLPVEEVVHRPESGLIGLSKNDTAYWRKRYDSSELHKLYVEERQKSERFINKESEGRTISRSLFSFRQWWILTRRNFRLKLKDRLNTMILLVQAPLIGLLLGLIFYGQEDRHLPLFMLVISGLWLGTSNAVREIVSEQAIYLRERMIGVGIPEYILSKFTVLLSLSVVQCFFLIGMAKRFVDLRSTFFDLMGIMVLVTCVGCGIGLLISALVRSRAAAQALIPLSVLPMVLLGAGIIPLPQTELAVAKAVTHAMPSRWGYEAAVEIESRLWLEEDALRREAQYQQALEQARKEARSVARLEINAVLNDKTKQMRFETENHDKKVVESVPEPPPVPADGYLVETLFEEYRIGFWGCCGVLLGYLATLLLATCLVQKTKDPI
ncbi:MAG: FHA domain-containing protein [Pseudodesulfovibrio sp.]|uniref:FHA domain-containing protein n=1 Tax=Pseudodesulfovibrio sp. TaxID=2035812 RepID=UPI003D10C155